VGGAAKAKSDNTSSNKDRVRGAESATSASETANLSSRGSEVREEQVLARLLIGLASERGRNKSSGKAADPSSHGSGEGKSSNKAGDPSS